MSDTMITARIALVALCLRGIERVVGGGCTVGAGFEALSPEPNWGGRPLRRRHWERVVGLIRIGRLAIEDLPDALEMAGLGWIGDRLRLPGLLETAFHLLNERMACTTLCDQYPARWQNKLGESAPGAVWWNGVDWRPAECECDIPDRPHAPVIAVVGSREPEDYTAALAERIGRGISDAGFAFCSGGAAGVDALAAQGFHGATTVSIDDDSAVGVHDQYGGFLVTPSYGWRKDHGSKAGRPRTNFVHYHKESAHGDRFDLAEFSCNPPRSAFSTAAAMERNQLIYAASDAAIVLQPRYRQGGTWHGAITAHRLRLCQLIVPENLGCLATRALIALGATPLRWSEGPAVDAPEFAARNLEIDGDAATRADALAMALRQCLTTRTTGAVTQSALGL